MPNHNTNSSSPPTLQNSRKMNSSQTKKTRRNPLSNLTNTIPISVTSSSSSSSTIKPTKPIFSSAIKTLLNKNSDAQITVSNNHDVVFDSPNPKTPSFQSDGRREPGSVYTRRKSVVKSKLIRGNDVSVNADSARDRVKKSEVVVEAKGTAKPPKKKKRKTSSVKDVADYSLPQDFIEKQRAYFAEIDAFELSEEEASADDLE